MKRLHSDDLAIELLRVLGIPSNNCRKVVLVFEPDNIAYAEVEYEIFPSEEATLDPIVTIAKKYHIYVEEKYQEELR